MAKLKDSTLSDLRNEIEINDQAFKKLTQEKVSIDQKIEKLQKKQMQIDIKNLSTKKVQILEEISQFKQNKIEQKERKKDNNVVEKELNNISKKLEKGQETLKKQQKKLLEAQENLKELQKKESEFRKSNNLKLQENIKELSKDKIKLEKKIEQENKEINQKIDKENLSLKVKTQKEEKELQEKIVKEDLSLKTKIEKLDIPGLSKKTLELAEAIEKIGDTKDPKQLKTLTSLNKDLVTAAEKLDKAQKTKLETEGKSEITKKELQEKTQKNKQKLQETNEKNVKELQEKAKKYEENLNKEIKKEIQNIDKGSKEEREKLEKTNESNKHKLSEGQKNVENLENEVENTKNGIKEQKELLQQKTKQLIPIIKTKGQTERIKILEQELKNITDQLDKTQKQQEKLNNLSKEKTNNSLALSENEIKRNELPNSIEKRFQELSKKSIELSKITQPNRAQKNELELIRNEIQEHGKFYLKQEKKQKEKFENAKDVIVNTLDSFLGEKNNKETLEKIIVNVGEKKKGAVLGQASKLVGKNLFKLLKLATYIPYLKKEGEKIPKILKGKTKYTPEKPPFFLTLIQDKALPGVITKNKQNLLDLGQKVMEIPFASKLLTPLGIDSKLLNKVGPNAIDLASSAIPLAGKIAQNLIKSPEDLTGIYNNLKEKNISNVIYQGSNIIKNLAPVLDKDLPEFINKNKDNLVIIAKESLAIEPIKKLVEPLGINSELVGKVMPNVLDIASSSLPLVNNIAQSLANSKDELSNAYKDFVEFGKEDGNKEQAISEIIANGSKIVQNLAPVLDKDLPEFINKNKDNLVIIAKESLAIEPIKKLVEPLGINSELVGKVMPNVLDIASSSLPLVNNIAQSLANSKDELSNAYKDFVEFGKEDGNKEQAISEIIANGSKIVQNLAPVLDKDLPEFINKNKDNLVNIAKESLAIEPIKKIVEPLGITPELVEKAGSDVLDIASSALPLVNNIAQSLAKSKNDLADIYKDFVEFGKEDGNKEQAISAMLANGAKIMEKLTPVLAPSTKQELHGSLPEFLTKNKKNIENIVSEVIKQPVISNTLAQLGISPSLVNEATSASIDLIAPMLPVITKLVNSSLKDQEGLKAIINQVQEIMELSGEINTLKEKQKNPEFAKTLPSGQKDLAAKLKGLAAEQEMLALKLVGSVLAFKDKNPEVKQVIEQEIPEILRNNAATLGPVIDKFLNQTPIGKNLRIKGEDMLKVAAKKMPQLVEAADLFTKKQYGKLIPKALKILFDKDVMKLAVTAVVDVIKLKYHEKTRWNSTRRTLAGSEINNALVNALKNKGDIGAAVEKTGQEAKGKTAKYSMTNRDFHGLHFDKQELKFDNCKLENFNLKDAKFGKASFKGAEIINCNFDKVEFKEKIDFTGMKIDKKSFESLMPAIKRYNDKHPEAKMTFENITVVSNDKKLELSKALEKIKGNLAKHVVTGKDKGTRNIAQTTDKGMRI